MQASGASDGLILRKTNPHAKWIMRPAKERWNDVAQYEQH
jgi:hypothetical protein